MQGSADNTRNFRETLDSLRKRGRTMRFEQFLQEIHVLVMQLGRPMTKEEQTFATNLITHRALGY